MTQIIVPLPAGIKEKMQQLELACTIATGTRETFYQGLRAGLGIPEGISVNVDIDKMTFTYEKAEAKE